MITRISGTSSENGFLQIALLTENANYIPVAAQIINSQNANRHVTISKTGAWYAFFQNYELTKAATNEFFEIGVLWVKITG